MKHVVLVEKKNQLLLKRHFDRIKSRAVGEEDERRRSNEAEELICRARGKKKRTQKVQGSAAATSSETVEIQDDADLTPQLDDGGMKLCRH